MRPFSPLLVILTLMVLAVAGAKADSAAAHCKVYHNGHQKPEASGHCQFSQRQGYIDIRLKNKAEWNLAPTQQANTYTDQHGASVKRSFDGGIHVYKWHDRTIRLKFGK